MANAKGGVHVMQLRPISVSKTLVEGCKFVKWDDDTTVGTPVTLKVDKKGFFLYWTDQNGDTEFLELSSIRDTRTGRYAKTPRNEGKLKESINIGPQDVSLEDKTLTVVYGPDFVNVNFVNFCSFSKETVMEWTNELLKMSYNLLAMNASVYTFLEKAHVRLCLMTERDGRLPVKNVIKTFASHKDDKKRIEKALEAIELPSAKNDCISLDKLDMLTFFSFYKNLIGRNEVYQIFKKICNPTDKAQPKNVMSVDQFVNFLNKEQRDPRLNEILYPYANRARGLDLIEQCEPSRELSSRGLLSFDGFLRYLMSESNAIIPPEKFDLNSDMDLPLNHYFVNSSHNTYLTGHQFTGKSSVEIYRQCLLAGCRCIELDCWNGRSDDEPIITHGYTVVSDVPLKEVLEAIAESSFKTSSYPVILSFENHCSSKQQAKMAQYCRKIFGDMLLTEPLPNHPLKPGVPLPSPNELLHKIIIKNKKKHHKRNRKTKNQINAEAQAAALDTVSQSPSKTANDVAHRHQLSTCNSDDACGGGIDSDDVYFVNGGSAQVGSPPSMGIVKNSSCDMEEADSDSSFDEDDLTEDPPSTDISMKEPEAGTEMSELVIYIQPIRFHAFELAEKRDRSFEVSSFDETAGLNLLKERPVDFVNYNKRQLSRVYPKGTRVNSSNYNPQVYWNAGCQMVALNFQTLDVFMQLNLGVFEYNGRNGYLLKPDFMRRHDRMFDLFTESTVDGIIAGRVTIKIISGQFLSDKRVGTYVEVDLFGLPADTIRRRRTKIVPANGLNPVYDEEPFIFKKVVLPDLASLRVAAFEENGKFIGTRILPIVGLRPGYRHISLRNESLQPLTLPTLFVHITVQDYIPDSLSELADALANPIAYQTMIEKHDKQLLALTDEGEESSLSSASNPEPSVSSANRSKMSMDKGHQSEWEEKKSLLSQDTAACELASSDCTVKTEVNGGNISSRGSSKVTSPSHKSLKRQETVNRKMTSSLKSHDEPSFERIPSVLETHEGRLTAESVDQLRLSKNVQKVYAKLEKDIATMNKKYDKARDKLKEVYMQEEDKALQFLDKQRKLATSSSKGSRKTSEGPKRSSIVGLQSCEEDYKAKIKELQKNFSESMLNLALEQNREELKVFQTKYHEQICAALEKAMSDSQSSQVQHLNSLHDKDCSALMKRIDVHNKEELNSLSKVYKDKNELNRIKRELQQRLIDQGVGERHRFKSLLDKRLIDLLNKHNEVRAALEAEKLNMLERRKLECEQRCARMQADYSQDSHLFVHLYLTHKPLSALK